MRIRVDIKETGTKVDCTGMRYYEGDVKSLQEFIMKKANEIAAECLRLDVQGLKLKLENANE
jgi:hypothetical protein